MSHGQATRLAQAVSISRECLSAHLAIDTADDASSDAVLQVQRATQSQYPLPHAQPLGGPHLHNWQRLVAVNLNHCQIRNSACSQAFQQA